MKKIYRLNVWIFLSLIIPLNCCQKDPPPIQEGLLNGLVGYWHLNEYSGVTLDLIGAHNGTPFAVIQGVSGKIGTGYTFSKSDKSYIDFGAIALTKNSFSFWAKRSDRGGWECIIGFGDNPFGLWIDPTNHICIANNTGAQIATWNEWTDLSIYHHIVLVTSAIGESGKVELYVDGISKGERSCNLAGITNFVLGSDYNLGAFNSPYSFNGSIDEVGLWSRALTSSEVVELYNLSEGQTYPFSNTSAISDVYFSPKMDVTVLLHSAGDKSVILGAIGSQRHLRYSGDNGVTYNNGINVTSGFVPLKARILENGIIVLFGKNEIYYSDDDLVTVNPCIVLDKDGSAYSYHVPVNTDYPGAYFYFMGGFVEYEGISILGSYTNTTMGASPINLYYSLDGITWRVFYTFGQNPLASDDGTPNGGIGGNLLGDPNNTIMTRHIHAVNVGGDGNFYVSTGDAEEEMHILKCNYNTLTDSWVVNDLLKGSSVTWQRMRALGVFERNGYLYWGSDGGDSFTSGGVDYEGFGIYKCAVSDINDPTKHILLQPLTDACYSFLNVNNVVIAGLQSFGYVYISFDYGETWSAYAKPDWMAGSVEGVWYNKLYRFFVTHRGFTIASKLFK